MQEPQDIHLNYNRNSLLIFVGLLLAVGAIFVHAENGRYTFSQGSERLTYAKLDTCTGGAWLCGADLAGDGPWQDFARRGDVKRNCPPG